LIERAAATDRRRRQRRKESEKTRKPTGAAAAAVKLAPDFCSCTISQETQKVYVCLLPPPLPPSITTATTIGGTIGRLLLQLQSLSCTLMIT
jgi:hypothetical protein